MIDWNDAFDNSGYTEGSMLLPDIWARQAVTTRQNLNTETDLAYGVAARHNLDLFLPEGEPLGLVVFVHGGYWHKFDKSYWSHLAEGTVVNGWAIALLSYPLAPAARISEMTAAVGQGINFAAQRISGPIRLVGHSAGGHLVSRMMCADSPLTEEVRVRLAKVVSVSGVHDLRPLLLTTMNQTLRLTDEEAVSESPALNTPLANVPVTFWVGAQERPEFLRQNRLIAEKWERQGAAVKSVYEADKHHFSVIDSLTQADGALTQEVLA